MLGGSTVRREVIKGGGYAYSANEARASYNGFEAVGGTCNDVGFRCVLDAVRVRRP
jgi:formylglycine-generating enzyme required for sulfatase activity